ncbi:MAG: hypothetical protein JW395_2316 [Nitrospira sp.]|nr:hypothetical protein [Nitrospira sp.]
MTKKQLPKGYPYSIRPFPPASKIATRPHQWGVNRYFQIEALLRSPQVIAAYRHDHTHQQFYACLQSFGIGGDPLTGAHQALLSVDTATSDDAFDATIAQFGCVQEGVTDLTALITEEPSAWWPNGGAAELLQQLRHPDPRFVYYRLDVSRPASPILKTLRPLLRAAHEQYRHKPADLLLDPFYKGTTPFQNIETWRRYFQCYDLKRTTTHTMLAIADQVYGEEDDGAVNTTMTALRRVRKVIRYAEQHRWPPPDVN